MRKTLAIVVGAAILLLAGGASADDPRTIAERARQAHTDGDAESLDAITSGRVDIWLVVEELLGTSDGKVAETLAKRARQTDAAALRTYIERRLTEPTPPALLEADRDVRALMAEGQVTDALARIDGVDLDGTTVTGIQLKLRRAGLSLQLKRPATYVVDTYAEAARDAEAIGWLATARGARLVAVRLASRAREFERTAELGTALLPLLKEGSAKTRVEINGRVAQALRALDRLDGAAVHARAAYAEADDPTTQRDTLRHLAMILIRSGKIHDATSATEALREREEQLKNARGVAACDVQLASLDAQLGDWTSAVARIERALAYFEVHGDLSERRGVHMHAARIFVEMLDADRAHTHIARAREAGKDLALNDGPLYEAEGAAFAIQGRNAEAASALEESLDQSTLQAGSRAGLLLGLATVLAVDGRTDEARSALDEAKKVARDIRDRILHARLLAAECRIELAAGDMEAAVQAGSEARRLCDESLLFQLASVIETRLAFAWLGQGDARKSLDHAERAIELILRRSAGLPERLGGQYRAELQDVFAVATDAAVRTGNAEALFSVIERGRAVSLRGRLGGSAILVRALDEETRKREATLQEQETLAVRRYRDAVQAGESNAIRNAFDALGGVRERLDRHREQIQAEHAVTAQILDPKVVSLKRVREQLAPHEGQVHYATGLDSVVALVVTKPRARIVTLAKTTELQDLLDGVVLEDASSPWKETVAELRGALVTPLALPAETTHVTFVPTGRLATVPFGALVPDKIVTLLPSATVGELLASRKSSGWKSVLAVGDPESDEGARLPGAATEAEAVGDVALVGKDATESGLRAALERLEGWRAVHLACHGLVDPVHPLRSSLALASDPMADGLWTVSEILASTIKSDLVVLAACSTGQGRTFEQEGQVGFVHAFFVAGTPRVVVTLWDVDDRATHALMTRFYDALANGSAPAAALRDAQQSVARDKRFAHPAYWSGWQVWGPVSNGR